MQTEATAPRTTVAPEAAPAPKAAKGRRAFMLLGVIAAAVVLAIGAYVLSTRGQETTDDAQVDADVVPIAARAGGQVLHVLVKDNQKVKAGTVLVELDPIDIAARLQQAEAELATAQAQLESAKAQEEVVGSNARGGHQTAQAALSGTNVAVSSADVQVAAAEASLQRAQAEARRAEMDLQRTKQLRAADAVAQAALDNAQVAYDSAQAALAQAKAGVMAAQEGKRAARSRVAEAEGRLAATGTIDAQMQAAHAATQLAEARVKSAQAAVTLAQNQVSYTKITAATDGTVSRLSVHEGQLVSVGQPIAELVPDQTYVVANFKETQIGQMKIGDHVKVKVDAFGGEELDGVVESISAGTGARFSLLPADNASGNFVKVVQRVPVRIAWAKQPDVPLRAGLSADVTVYVGSGKGESAPTAVAASK